MSQLLDNETEQALEAAAEAKAASEAGVEVMLRTGTNDDHEPATDFSAVITASY